MRDGFCLLLIFDGRASKESVFKTCHPMGNTQITSNSGNMFKRGQKEAREGPWLSGGAMAQLASEFQSQEAEPGEGLGF